MDLVKEVVPPSVINVVTGSGGEIGNALATNSGIAKMAFTGSTDTGARILKVYTAFRSHSKLSLRASHFSHCSLRADRSRFASRGGARKPHPILGPRVQAAAECITPTTLELGGKSPCIFFSSILDKDDALLDKAVEGAVMFAMNQGEVCTCQSRLLVQEDICDRFMERVVERTEAIKTGDPLDPETMMGAQVMEWWFYAPRHSPPHRPPPCCNPSHPTRRPNPITHPSASRLSIHVPQPPNGQPSLF
jgi:aldehyde dehydrogenase